MSAEIILISALILLVLLWVFTHFYLGGENLSRYDGAPETVMRPANLAPSQGHVDALNMLNERRKSQPKGSFREVVPTMRETIDALGSEVPLDGVRIQPVDVDGVAAEWVLADNADPNRRLLYLHGGGFMAGSALSHRAITTRLAKSQGTSVLAINYRLLPEHRRMDCMADCQTSYRWILENGPEGTSSVKTFFAAGDSAGALLLLALVAWARDEGLRPVNAAVALSPPVDGTCSSKSMRENIPTDPMLGPDFGKLMKIPRSLLLWFSLFSNRARPHEPWLSPIHGDLSNLPPILVHVSSAEMFFDDACRYVNKAKQSGTTALLQVWPHMLHVWHIFHDQVPEGDEAMLEIEKFMAANS
ncbi:Monoterpene epsilon-lactone hydrolase [Zhongshania aliphaticivorans]|uniref:Monoterpene epsilon-lactone hydrolase n=1 Tax=Zhongshania aliphaticivorans TaxID=1470434 RepID=A0A5S9Q184_9GAMM|nr:alpha/beta hydrolase [Zhongshania aliphaticivorans]CAA0093401.1 Monoterpene epsilon-lactone hydrolase [Zhongshania aliphaticivorans]CAA0111292.1 Monoterpene epsilon-lactone hydrolase [Zhongshania aliphaticivorans]